MTARECWFCFVPATAALCSGQAAFKYSHSRGSRLQMKPGWKTRGETERERSPGAAPCPSPALPKAELAGAGRVPVSGVQELWGSFIPICQKEGAMEGAEMLRKRVRRASCSLPAPFLRVSSLPCLM